MIRNNLAILMAQRSTKISKIAAETGIARSTLNSISQNESKMIQLETIDKLCQSLEVTPCDFFSYLPLDLSIYLDDLVVELDADVSGGVTFPEIYFLNLSCTVVLTISSQIKKKSYAFSLKSNKPCHFARFNHDTLKLSITIDEDDDKKKIFMDEWKKISVDFRTDIKKQILKSFVSFIKEKMPSQLDSQLFDVSDYTKKETVEGLDSLRINATFDF